MLVRVSRFIGINLGDSNESGRCLSESGMVGVPMSVCPGLNPRIDPRKTRQPIRWSIARQGELHTANLSHFVRAM
jgi:hypothetical protein